MPDINEEFLDYDFAAYLADESNEHVAGCLADDDAELFGDYESAIAPMTTSQVREAVEAMDAAGVGTDQLVTRIFDQKREGSCVSQACAQAHQILQALQVGKENVTQLSAISLYKRIGRSASSGAVVGHGVREMAERGILPLDTPENREQFGNAVMPNTGFRERYPADWELTATKFASLEVYNIRTWEGMLTAGALGHPVIVGREGHSICLARLMWDGRKWAFKYPNSWGERWGSSGYGFDSERQIKKSASRAYALRSVKILEGEA